MRLFKLVGIILLFLASMAFITGISLFVAGGFLATWPLLRMSPSDRRTRALVQAGVTFMALVQAFRPLTEGDEDAPKSA